MDSFRRNQEQFKSAVEGAFANSPFAEITKRNIEMFEAATEAFKSGHPAPAAEASKDDEIAALKAELARLQDTIEKLAKSARPLTISLPMTTRAWCLAAAGLLLALAVAAGVDDPLRSGRPNADSARTVALTAL